jgi:ABC-type nickel/cobalt efflux system permease component RcnA
MTFAVSRGVPQAGIVFAFAMMGGVALTLFGVALLANLFRELAARLLEARLALLDGVSRSLEGLAGGVLVIVAVREMLR